MVNSLRAKIFSTLKTISGLSDSNVFYKRAKKGMTGLYVVISTVSENSDNDTEQEVLDYYIQISVFDEPLHTTQVSTMNESIKGKMTKSGLSGMGDYKVNWCKFKNSHELIDGESYQKLSVFNVSVTKK